MKNGMKAFLLGGKECKGGVGVLAAVAGAVISIGGTILSGVISNKLADKANREIEADTEEEKKELETDVEEVKAEEVVVEEETNKKG